jgi:hypothetical protein
MGYDSEFRLIPYIQYNIAQYNINPYIRIRVDRNIRIQL